MNFSVLPITEFQSLNLSLGCSTSDLWFFQLRFLWVCVCLYASMYMCVRKSSLVSVCTGVCKLLHVLDYSRLVAVKLVSGHFLNFPQTWGNFMIILVVAGGFICFCITPNFVVGIIGFIQIACF